ncbi:MAG TPA: sialidase family protein [Pyrinomonadaceae bacterium]|jgi:hypothetical protein
MKSLRNQLHTYAKLSVVVLIMTIVSGLLITMPKKAGAVGGTPFGPPVKVTPELGYGYEPTVVVDRFGNIFATAHKENWQLVLAPDINSPTYTRSMSWAWVSVDGGHTFDNIPGLTSLSLEQHEFGDEGDMALDDAGHLYYVDTNVADDSFTRWSVAGPGLQNITLDFTRPLVPAAQLVDDRPWVTAHGNGHVFYLGNEGDKVTYPLGQGTGSGFGPGRYTVYSSYDGGQTFDSLGYTLKDSGWCRPASDHAAGSPYVYVVCGNDGGSNDVYTPNNPKGTLYAYISADDGHTFERYVVGSYNSTDSTFSWPTVEVAPDGSIWALYVDAQDVTDCGTDITGFTTCDPVTNRLMLYHSTDRGATWKGQDITPGRGRYQYGWLAVSRDGRKLGVGVYYRPNLTAPWRVYGSVFRPGQKPILTSLDEFNPVAPASAAEPPGDYMNSYFNPDGTLNVIWTRREFSAGTTILRSIYFARSL